MRVAKQTSFASKPSLWRRFFSSSSKGWCHPPILTALSSLLSFFTKIALKIIITKKRWRNKNNSWKDMNNLMKSYFCKRQLVQRKSFSRTQNFQENVQIQVKETFFFYKAKESSASKKKKGIRFYQTVLRIVITADLIATFRSHLANTLLLDNIHFIHTNLVRKMQRNNFATRSTPIFPLTKQEKTKITCCK